MLPSNYFKSSNTAAQIVCFFGILFIFFSKIENKFTAIIFYRFIFIGVSAVANAHHKRIHNRTYGSAGGSGGSLDNVTGFNCGTDKSFSEAFIYQLTHNIAKDWLNIELQVQYILCA